MTTPVAIDPLAAMADELAAADVHVGFPDEREALARLLLGAGVPPSDVAALAQHCRDTVVGTAAAARVLVSLLIDHRKRDDRLADLRRVAEAKARRAPEPARPFGDAPYVPGPTEGEPREVWDHDRQCRVAWCRVNGDRAKPGTVAADLGVSLATLGTMLDRGRTLCTSPLTKVEEKPPTPARAEREAAQESDRRAEFRSRMRVDAAKRRRGEPKPFDWVRMAKEQGAILAGVRERGVVDLAACLRDPVRRGALATLEADGHILRAGDVDARQCQPYVAARDDAERRAFALQTRAWGQKKPRPSEEAQAPEAGRG